MSTPQARDRAQARQAKARQKRARKAQRREEKRLQKKFARAEQPLTALAQN